MTKKRIEAALKEETGESHASTRGVMSATSKLAEAAALPIEVQTITPEMATRYLQNNTKNRTTSKVLVAGYARDMKSGDWDFTGDPIRIARDGSLIDGQHRLQACVRAGAPFVAVVIKEMDEKIQDVIDSGRKRTMADTLSISGHKHAVRVVAMARWLLYIKSERISNSSAKVTVTHRELHSIINRHPHLEDSASMTQNSLGVPPSLLAAIHYIGHNILLKQNEADSFVAVFVSGKQSYPNDPALIWRERLLRMKERKTSFNRDLILRGSINCWNQFSEKEEAKFIRIPEVVKFTGLDYSKL